MKTTLAPINKRLAKKALDEIDALMAGKQTSTYTRLVLPVPATEAEVKQARKAVHASQRKFAQVVGVSVETVKAWEAGKRVPEGPATKIIRLLRRQPAFAATLIRA